MKGLRHVLGQMLLWAVNLIRNLRRKVLSYLTLLDAILYQRNITRRRVRRVARFLAIVTLIIAYSVMLVFFGVFVVAPSIGTALPAIVHSIVQSITSFGAWLNLSNPSEFATILVAEVIAILGSSIIARIFSRGPKLIVPKLDVIPLLPETNTDGVKSFKLTVSNERGETGALDCQVSMAIEGLERRDVLDITGTKFTSTNFTDAIEVRALPWVEGAKVMTLRSGLVADVELVRLVPATDEMEAHFEIPSSEPSSRLTICLRLKTFYLKVVVAPINGKHLARSYTIGKSFQTGEWVLS